MKLKKLVTAKVFQATLGVLFALSAIYYVFFTLDSEPLSTQEILDRYQYSASQNLNFELNKLEENLYEFHYRSFDGAKVKGQIHYPEVKKDRYPVLLGMHAMGRSYPRWWVDSLKGRPTVTQVNKITQIARNKGYVVIAIDARYHGSRKKADRSLRSIMIDLTFLGDKDDYVRMIRDTVLDYRVLLDWIEQQKELDISNTHVAGYSMGGQMSLLLAAVDVRISNVLSIVPPYLEDTTASVAPKNVVSLLDDNKVWLVTSDDDENATHEENVLLFKRIPSKDKKHIVFKGNHILPEEYVNSLVEWF
ncbi:alpha/beta fold hydrolase [Pleionea sp. CnH1-48]|uniref:alpha/beta fold hydrolase n=1 Tax=Pleionea sp. CnH1-48 TaxID=2954494 RepID=UPI002096E9F6|nr:alpha/beta fold hydrolase [Pleionea sp. CnH1-48]MCO7223648.1 alpha/beta fold hydrolase [Pleionea sp. CnH1-48]